MKTIIIDGVEYNLTPKVAFREGDWVVYCGKTCKITGLQNGIFTITNQDGSYFFNRVESTTEPVFHLWTIQDAKDGDVLFLDLMGGETFIYNGINPNMAILYSFIINNDGEDVLPYHIGKPNVGIGNIEETKNIIHPATKEQRDILFQRMKEAGYVWNKDKKKLIKL